MRHAWRTNEKSRLIAQAASFTWVPSTPAQDPISLLCTKSAPQVLHHFQSRRDVPRRVLTSRFLRLNLASLHYPLLVYALEA
jgi:hypothetical protein